MTCLRTRWGHNNVVVPCSEHHKSLSKLHNILNGRISSSSCSLKLNQSQMSRLPRLRVVAVHTDSNSSSSSSVLFDHQEGLKNDTKSVLPAKRVVEKEEIVSGKVDQWIRDSVEQIVHNIEEAPFLMHIYSNNEGGSSSTRVVREKASADNWPAIKTRWEGESSIPNGVALVEELNSHNSLLTEIDQPCSSSHKVWGIVIQEKGVTCPACYILKTSRVRSLSGVCTHFCLFRAECFNESAEMQLKNLWLQD